MLRLTQMYIATYIQTTIITTIVDDNQFQRVFASNHFYFQILFSLMLGKLMLFKKLFQVCNDELKYKINKYK